MPVAARPRKRAATLHCWLCVVVSGMLAMILFSAVAQADWPEFRGPDGQGHATGAVPLQWDESTNIKWKQALPGVAWSSPVIVNGRIYLTTAVAQPTEGDDKKTTLVDLGVLCLDEATGNVLWEKNILQHTADVEIHKKNSHASPTPIIEGDALYVHFGSNGTARLKLNGDIVWTAKLDYAPQHGNGGSPAIAGDVLVICCDGTDVQYVVGMEKATGKVRWKRTRETEPSKGFSFCTPLVLTINGRPQAVCPGSDVVSAYDPATGDEIWKVRYEGGFSVTPRPVYGNGLVYVCTGFMKPILLAIDPTGTGDVTESHVKWKTDRQVPHSPSLLLVDKLLFFVSDKGIARCVDAVTGEEHWEERLGGNFSASPILAGGRVYFQDEEGTATVVAASPKYEVLAKNQLSKDERTFASYAVDGDALFLRSEKHLYRIEGAK